MTTNISKWYRRTKLDDMKGKSVRALRELRNGSYSIPAGTVLEIDDKRGGFSLITPRCSSCGIRVFITRVQPEAVELAE